jgi:dGTPase
MEKCAQDRVYADKIMPSTLEGAVVRLSDIIAYLGKDRQDAMLAKAIRCEDFNPSPLGTMNDEIVNNLIVNVIENSYAKPYIRLDDAHFEALRQAKKENYQKIYDHAGVLTGLKNALEPMMSDVYGQLLEDLKSGKKASPIFTQHIYEINREGYEKTEPNQLVVDYIASMTDDYFIELHEVLFPNSNYKLQYRGYFGE